MKRLLMLLIVLILMPVKLAWAPTPSLEDELTFFIMRSHHRMGEWQKAVGRTCPWPLSYKRARKYADLLLFHARRRGMQDQFWTGVLPYLTHESGFINTINDLNLVSKAHGIFGLQVETAIWIVTYLCDQHADKRGWSKAKWRRELVVDYGLNIDLGMTLASYYLHTYHDDVDRMFKAFVAGPGGVKTNAKVNMALFRIHQKKALAFARFVRSVWARRA